VICIGFGTNEKLYSKVICWASRSDWSHTWIEYPSGVWGGRWAIHATPDGLIKVPLERVHARYTRRKAYECKCDLEEGFKWGRQHVSAEYDYGVIWNLILLVLLRATGWVWLWEMVARNLSKYSCSEYVMGFLKAAGVFTTDNERLFLETTGVMGATRVDPELTTPGDLERFCEVSDDFQAL